MLDGNEVRGLGMGIQRPPQPADASGMVASSKNIFRDGFDHVAHPSTRQGVAERAADRHATWHLDSIHTMGAVVAMTRRIAFTAIAASDSFYCPVSLHIRLSKKLPPPELE